jgi:hypothetical protein
MYDSSHYRVEKKNACDVFTVVISYHNATFPPGLIGCCTLHALFHQLQRQFIPMIDTDVSFLPNYNNITITICLFMVTWASARPRDVYMQMRASHVGGPHQGFPCSLLPGFLSNREPQPVARVTYMYRSSPFLRLDPYHTITPVILLTLDRVGRATDTPIAPP